MSVAAAWGIGRKPSVTFNSGAQLDPDQVTDVRGRSVGGRGLAVGGAGGLGLVIAIAYLLLGGDPSALLAPSGAQPADGPIGSQLTQECKTGAQANERADCRIVGFVNSIQAYWKAAYAQEGGTYQPAQTIIFQDSVGTGCGPATTDVGPFYCPPDTTVYLDLGFFNELHDRFGAEGGPLAEGYVVAHEYGHHIQDLEGILNNSSGATGAQGQSVRTELQADCLAGVWVNHAASTGYIEQPTQDQIGQALDAAAAVGDD